MSIVHDLLLKILIFLLDALTYMFQQHLHMCIIHPLTFPLWKNLAKTRFGTDYACANFLQEGWDDVIRVSRRSAARWLGHVWWCKQRGAGWPATQPLIY